MKMNKKLFFFIVIGIWLSNIFWGCEDKFSTNYPHISVSLKRLDSLISLGSGRNYKVEVEISSNSGFIAWENVLVNAQIFDSTDLLKEFVLLDNGNSGNGDFLDGDHVYSNWFNDSLFINEGEYTIRINVVYLNEELSMDKKLKVLQVLPFGFHVLNSSDTIPEKDHLFTLILDSGITYATYNLDIAVLDTNGGNGSEIKIVKFTDIEFIQNQYQLKIDSSFGAGLKGEYFLRFDLSLNSIQSQSYFLSDPVYVLNSAPIIEKVFIPDSLKIPVGSGVVEDTIYVQVNDHRGIKDITRTYYRVKKPDGTYSNSEFDLHNNGTGPDAVAEDNIFTAGFSLDSSALPGTYIFEFRTVDKVNQKSDIVAVPIVLY